MSYFTPEDNSKEYVGCELCVNGCPVLDDEEQKKRRLAFLNFKSCGGYMHFICPTYGKVFFKAISDEPENSNNLKVNENILSWNKSMINNRRIYKKQLNKSR